MASIQKISGALTNTGPCTYTGPNGHVESATIYEYLRIEGDGGREYYLEKVVVPSYLDVACDPGLKGVFYLVTIPYPKLFGSHPIRYLFGISSNGKLRGAIPQTERCVTRGNGGYVFQLLVLGAFLLPAFGFGMLFWLLALRLILVKVPVDKMQQALNAMG